MDKYANEVENSQTGSNFKPAPANNYVATCVGIAILGTIDHEYDGHKSRKKSVRLYFELVGTSNPEDEGKPFVVGQDYTNSMGSNANFRKLIEGWRGSKFTSDEAEKFNMVKLLNFSCMLNLSVKKSAKGTEYNDILNLSPVPAGMPVAVRVTEPFLFNFNPPFKQAEFDLLEKFVQDKIKSSDEYAAILNSKPASNAGAGTASTPPVAATVAGGEAPF